MLLRQLASLFDDLPIAAVKTGMLATTAHVRAVATFLRQHPVDIVVVDPVMVATSGDRLQHEDAASALCDELLPLASVATPNVTELAALTGMQAQQPQDLAAAARRLLETGCGAVVVTGGDTTGDTVVDILVDANGTRLISTPRVDTPFTHGTGCTFAAALACCQAQGQSMQQAVVAAKTYVSQTLQAALDLGRGRGATDHFAAWRRAANGPASMPAATPAVTVGELR
jgi:hydroxymethylpyrimidine/phosphomethylpyrimidine kinase